MDEFIDCFDMIFKFELIIIIIYLTDVARVH